MALTSRIGCPDCGYPAEVTTVTTLLEDGSASATVHADCACGVRDVELVEAEKPKPRKKAAKKSAPSSTAGKGKAPTKAPAKKAGKK